MTNHVCGEQSSLDTRAIAIGGESGKCDAIVYIEYYVAAHVRWPGRRGGQDSTVQAATTNACVNGWTVELP